MLALSENINRQKRETDKDDPKLCGYGIFNGISGNTKNIEWGNDNDLMEQYDRLLDIRKREQEQDEFNNESEFEVPYGRVAEQSDIPYGRVAEQSDIPPNTFMTRPTTIGTRPTTIGTRPTTIGTRSNTSVNDDVMNRYQETLRNRNRKM